MLSRKALGRIHQLMGSANEHVALKASSDVLDRNPETSKTFKHSVSGLILDGQDAKELAEALVAGARVKEQYRAIAEGDFVKVEAEDGEAARGNGQSGAEGNHGKIEGQEAPRSVAERETDQGQATQGTTEGTVVLKPDFEVMEER